MRNIAPILKKKKKKTFGRRKRLREKEWCCHVKSLSTDIKLQIIMKNVTAMKEMKKKTKQLERKENVLRSRLRLIAYFKQK